MLRSPSGEHAAVDGDRRRLLVLGLAFAGADGLPGAGEGRLPRGLRVLRGLSAGRRVDQAGLPGPGR